MAIQKSVVVWTLGAVLAVLAGCSDADSAVDRSSYTKGYEALGYNETVQGAREDIEHRCDDLYGELAPMYNGQKKKVVRADWVQGCADAAQNMDSRF
ncbi:hypothetical protein [Streptomyces sp. NBC_01760]|uniref:hypothetical protein n=1 Tax=Streptomyces sp. NBC_01760 TaxID=2975931 RepID=UPI002DD9F9CF|nr:hypothetical protein [Streptomyces sp. NBC_01760]WSC72097.1 hypothetical protein OG807_28515 [Streptomyces sp. NBC_01760]